MRARTAIALLAVTTTSLVLGLLPRAALAEDAPRAVAPRASGPFAATDAAVIQDFTHGQAEVKIAPDGTFALVAVDSYLQKVDLTSDPIRVVGTRPDVAGHVLAISPDSRWAYVVDEPPTIKIPNTLYVLDVRGGNLNPVKVRTGKKFVGKGEVADLEISRNGKYLYVKQTNKIKVLSLKNPKKPKLVGTVRAKEGGGELSITRDGKRLLSLSTVGNGWLTVYNLPRKGLPRKVARHNIHAGDVFAVASNRSTDAAYLVTDSNSIQGPTQYLRLAARNGRGAGAWTIPDYEDVTDASLSPDGRYLFVVSLGGTSSLSGVVDTTTMQPVSDLAGTSFGRAVAWSTGGPTAGRAYVVTRATQTGQRVLVEVSPS